MECDVHYAKTNLSKLLKQAESGEEVIITRSGQRFQLQVVAAIKSKPKFGTLRGKVKAVKESQLFAMPDDEADAFIEGRW
ncbi:MAG: type II toxin-antitoxin system Phd/YefM family antitoxin [Bryobacteraceae bacterium]